MVIEDTNTSLMIKSVLNHTKNNEQKDNMLINSIQKGQLTRFRFERVLRFDYCLLTFSMMNIFLSILYYEADYTGKLKIADFCLKFTDICTIIQILVTIFRYLSQVELQKSQKILEQEQNIISTGKIYQILFEIFVLLIQPTSLLNDVNLNGYNIYDRFQFEYKLNYYLVVLGFFKIFIAIRVFLLHQQYMTPRSNRLCRMYGSQSNYLYSIKCLFKDSPMKLIGCVFACSILIFSICLRIAQRNLIKYASQCSGTPGFIQNFQNAIWLTFITMTTVGYGDFFPRTLFGRAIDVFLIIWGTFIVSLMVVVLTNTLNMDQAQKRALIVLNRLQAKKQLKQAAAFLITLSCRKYLIYKNISLKKRVKLTDNQSISLENKFMKYLSNFQNVHRSIRSMYDIDDVYEEMTRQFQVISDQMGKILIDQQETILKITKEDKDKDKNKNTNTTTTGDTNTSTTNTNTNNTTNNTKTNNNIQQNRSKPNMIRHSIIKQPIKNNDNNLGEEDWLGIGLVEQQTKKQPENKKPKPKPKPKKISIIKEQVQEENVEDQMHWF